MGHPGLCGHVLDTTINIGFGPHCSPVSHCLGSTARDLDNRADNPVWVALKSSILTQHGVALRHVTWLQ